MTNHGAVAREGMGQSWCSVRGDCLLFFAPLAWFDLEATRRSSNYDAKVVGG